MKFFASAFVALASACIAFALGQGTFDRTLRTSGQVHLDVRSDIGGITLTGGSSEAVRVHAVLKAQYGPIDLARAEAHIRALEQNPPIEQSGESIRIGYPKDPSLLEGVSMHLEIEAPQQSQIQAHTSSGGIRVDGIGGPVQAQSHSGRVELRAIVKDVRAVTHSGVIIIQKVGGPVFAQNDSGGIRVADSHQVTSQTGSGRIEIANTTGETRAITHSGSIFIHKANGVVFARNNSGSVEAAEIAGAINVQTGSGAIRLSQVKAAPIRARANSGIIRVKLAPGAGYTIAARSDRGRISIPQMKAQGKIERHQVDGSIGAGGPLVDVGTDSSKIVID